MQGNEIVPAVMCFFKANSVRKLAGKHEIITYSIYKTHFFLIAQTQLPRNSLCPLPHSTSVKYIPVNDITHKLYLENLSPHSTSLLSPLQILCTSLPAASAPWGAMACTDGPPTPRTGPVRPTARKKGCQTVLIDYYQPPLKSTKHKV